MIEKNIIFEYGDNNSEVITLIDEAGLEKTAGISDVILNFIRKSLAPKPDKTYALVNALSSGEYYGPNNNGDYFPEDGLKEYHKTFEELAHVYEMHVNKDPKRSLGRPIFSHYNPVMHRVELILELDNKKASNYIDRMRNQRELPAVSMGCRVAYDICSVCGSKAKRRIDYCNHLRHEMGKVMPDGKRVYAINDKPKFFDISIVRVPADKTASFLKIFSNIPIEKSAEKKNYMSKVASIEEKSYINSNETNDIDMQVLEHPELQYIKYRFEDETVEKLASRDFGSVMSTMLGLRIIPSKEDFQKIALYSMGQVERAEDLDRKNLVFSDEGADSLDLEKFAQEVNYDNFDPEVAKDMIHEVPYFSLTKNLATARGIAKIAMGQQEAPDAPNPIVPSAILSGLYYGYLKTFGKGKKDLGKFSKYMQKNPWLLAVTGIAAPAAVYGINKMYMEKSATPLDKLGAIHKALGASLLTVPVSYLAAGNYERNKMRGDKLNIAQEFVRKNPAITGIAGGFLGGYGKKIVKNVKEQLKKTAEAIYDISNLVEETNKLGKVNLYNDLFK